MDEIALRLHIARLWLRQQYIRLRFEISRHRHARAVAALARFRRRVGLS
jgi:hypothetical protein